jgi:hypoxia up-regulated 1
LLKVDLLDVAETVANLTEQDVSDPIVKLTMKIDSRGLLSAVNAIACGEQKNASLTGKLMGLFGGSKEKTDEDTGGDLSEEEKAAAEKQEAKPKEKKVALRFSEHAIGVKPLSPESKKASKRR